ncbi:MAG: hypothetical protein IJC76_01295 [Lachnospiraceae bacterium]|nr:hypothetical protein [Lachnospiraceae bacterium]
MKKIRLGILLYMIMIIMTGCGVVGNKSTSLSIIYGIVSIVSLLMLIVYCTIIHNKEVWFLFLFFSVFIVNTGYFALSISKNLQEALLANRIAYLGSVFLPLSMFMIIISVCKIKYKKILPAFLILVSIVVFLIAASPGYLDIYYKEVEFCVINGVGGLKKVYGTWHGIYLFYLFIYFGIMVIAIVHTSIKNKLESKIHAIIFAGAVFVNIIVWLIEQLVNIEFEILSVSYIISEFFLICFCYLRQEGLKYDQVQTANDVKEPISEEVIEESQKITTVISDEDMEKITFFLQGVDNLTPTETKIYNLYLEEKTTKEVLKIMNITENTLKYHNKNIYSKLGVSSRKQLKEIAKIL